MLFSSQELQIIANSNNVMQILEANMEYEVMESQRAPTNAFEKYVDGVLLIQSELFFFLPRINVNGCSETPLQDYLDERRVRAAICQMLAEKIGENIPFSQTKEKYKTLMRELASSDLDYTGIRKQKDKLDRQFFTYAKFEYCKRNFLSALDLNNDLATVGVLAILYDKITKMLREQGKMNVPIFSRTKLFKYIQEAMREEDMTDIKSVYKNKSVSQLIERLFHVIAINKYEFDNSTEETMASAVDDKNYILQIHVVEENNEFAEYKQKFENEVYDWLVKEMHLTEDGMYF